VTGGSWDPTTGADFMTVKYTPTGSLDWVRRYDGPGHYTDGAVALACANDGSVYVVGNSISAGPQQLDKITTIKYSATGNTLWVRRYESVGIDEGDKASGLALDPDGNILVIGSTLESLSPSASTEITTIKYSPSGDTLWKRSYGDHLNGYDEAAALSVDTAGFVYVTGLSGGGPGLDYATIKYSPSGDTVWARRYNGTGNGSDEPVDIAVDDSGYVYVTGWSARFGLGADFATIKYTAAGDTVWTRRFGVPGSRTDGATSLKLDPCGNVYVTGRSYQDSTYNDIVTLMYSPAGDLEWQIIFDGPGSAWPEPPSEWLAPDLPNDMAIGANGDVFVVGYADWGGWFRAPGDYTVLKYVQSCPILLTGDANTDAAITAADIIVLVNFVLKGGSAPEPIPEAGDTNCNDAVNSSDIIVLVNHVFKGGPAPCDACALIPVSYSCP
jgi:uncharacterized delta-60 repeat protein